MITSLNELLLTILLLPFAWISLDWCLGRLRERRERFQQARKIRTCHLCQKTYPESWQVKISICPDCSALNRRRGHRKLG